MIEPKETIFSDLSLAFKAHPVTGKLKILTNVDSIKQSVKNIVLTNFYEKPYNPTFGGNIIAQLFENMTSQTKFILENNIKIALRNYEPRADVIDIRTNPDFDNNTLNVSVTFKPVNDLALQTVNILLERVR